MIAVLVALSVPVTYVVAAYTGRSATLTARAEGLALAVNRLVSASPDLWQYQHYRLEVQLQRFVAPWSTEHARILDAGGRVIVDVGALPPQPVIVRSAPLYDSGILVGRVEAIDTLADLVWQTLAAALLGLALAGAAFYTLLSLPLRALDKALDEAEAGRIALMEAQRIARMGSWEFDPAGAGLTASEHLLQLLGVASTQSVLRKSWWARIHGSDRPRLHTAMRAWLSGASAPQVEFRIRTQPGSEHVMLARCEIMRDAGSAVSRLRGTVLDITEQKRAQQEVRRLNQVLEHRVKERTSELTHTVRELEAFTYSVAHDLRAPIRSINNFSHLLLRSAGTALDDTAQRYTDRIIAASGRMAALIDGLLELARVNRVELRLMTVDLSDLARAILERKAKTAPARAVRFEIDPGLTAKADGALMRAALDQLLDNAWKFTAHTAEPLIEFRRVQEHGRPAFLIRDNGAGFDMRYAHKLFETFQRLHHAREYPGTGIGLVMVQRIITRHGGSVRVASEVGKGTEVYFTV
ncbi:MAG TPA: ATP-binding protein [Burkholderiales bacterium]|nr:ATP-binding protein [Burkholderiales bacterium]